MVKSRCFLKNMKMLRHLFLKFIITRKNQCYPLIIPKASSDDKKVPPGNIVTVSFPGFITSASISDSNRG